MEMNFPHPASRQMVINDRRDYQTMLATAIERQANSQTARVMAVFGLEGHSTTLDNSDELARLIHYFGSDDHDAKSPTGAFSTASCGKKLEEQICKSGVYQNASTNIKAHDLDDGAIGEQSNQTGHGASRIL
jgi:hypothetical protein